MPPGAQQNRSMSLDDPANIRGAVGFDKAVQAAMTDTGVKGLKEVLSYFFYDSTPIANGATSTTALFASASTDIAVSNFVGSGQMPSGQAFLVRTMRVIFAIGTSVADCTALMKGLAVSLVLENSKKYAEGLAQAFPAGQGMSIESFSGVTTPTAGTSVGNNGVPVLGNVYRFDRPVTLHSQQPFQVNIRALAPVLGATTRVFVHLDGVYVRNVL